MPTTPKTPAPPEEVEKVKDFMAHLDTFEWTLKLMPQDKDQLPPGQLLTVSLHVKAYRVDPTKGFAEARITKEQAAKIIDVLAKDNSFRESVADHSRLPAVPEGPYALMCMNHDQKNQQTQDVQRVTACRVLERDANLVKRLQAIRQCVDGEAAQMIGQLLKSLPAEGDADKIRGAWKVVSAIQTAGFEDNQDVVEYKNSVWTFGDKEFTITKGKAETKLAYTLDPTKKPKQIDLGKDLAGTNLRRLGIYKVEGDKLTISYILFNCRPKNFSMPRGIQVYKALVVLERQKK